MRKQHKLYKKTEELLNKRFSRLVVLEITDIRYRNSRLIKCLCNCSNIIFTTGSRLKNGTCKSCGCLQKELAGKVFRKNPGEAGFNRLFEQYERAAKRHKKLFLLTKEEFRNLTQQNCYYCGQIPNYKFKLNKHNMSPEAKNYASYVGNGVDRINSNIGYILNNCVPCCKTCNIMKNTKSVDEFIYACKRVVNYSIIKKSLEPATLTEEEKTALAEIK